MTFDPLCKYKNMYINDVYKSEMESLCKMIIWNNIVYMIIYVLIFIMCGKYIDKIIMIIFGPCTKYSFTLYQW